MSVTIETPDAEGTCAYCESRVFDHDPICVRARGIPDGSEGHSGIGWAQSGTSGTIDLKQS